MKEKTTKDPIYLVIEKDGSLMGAIEVTNPDKCCRMNLKCEIEFGGWDENRPDYVHILTQSFGYKYNYDAHQTPIPEPFTYNTDDGTKRQEENHEDTSYQHEKTDTGLRKTRIVRTR